MRMNASSKCLLTAIALGFSLVLGCAAAPAMAAADRGKAMFTSKCGACHSLAAGRNGLGPNLKGVAGRRAAAVSGYVYSAAMKKSGLVWDSATLDRFLAAPVKVVPGTKMPIATANPADRTALIAFLKAQP